MTRTSGNSSSIPPFWVRSNPANYHAYGAIDPAKMPDLAARYLLVTEDFASQVEADISAQLNTPTVALLGLCHAFGGQANSNYFIRLRAVQGGNLIFSSPGSPAAPFEVLVEGGAAPPVAP